MRITEARLRQIIEEEVENRLLVEEIKSELLNEGVVSWLKRTFGSGGWEELVDDIEEDGEIDKKLFLDFPSKKKMAAMALIGLISAGTTEFATEYAANMTTSEIGASEKIRDALFAGQTKAKDIQNFREIAQGAGGEGTVLKNQNDVNLYLDSLRTQYALDPAPLDIGRGVFIDGDVGKPATGFAYVPADQIDDDTVLPLVGMTKADYELFLRLNWLGGANDDSLKKLVMGGWTSGSAAFWGYQDSLFSPVADESSPEMAKQMAEQYGEAAKTTLMLPLEWSVAYQLMSDRANRQTKTSDVVDSERSNGDDGSIPFIDKPSSYGAIPIK